MKPKTILLCLIAALALSACAGVPPTLKECGGNNCRHEPTDPDPFAS